MYDVTHPTVTKADWRSAVMRGRRARDAASRERATRELSHAVSVLASDALARGDDTIAAYVPVGSEPGAISMLDAARGTGVRVLLPVAREPGPMSWAEYHDDRSLVAAPHGLREPGGPVLPPEAIREAGLVLVPALAVDRRGVRLGRGAGFYDRTLHTVRADALLVAVVFDEELVPHLPSEGHDVVMTHSLTPSGGLRASVPE